MVDYFLALVVLGIGTSRLTALASRDAIFDGLRDKLYHMFPPENNRNRDYQNLRRTTKQEREEAKPLGFGWWDRQWQETADVYRKPSFIGKMVDCYFCLSVWISVVNFALYYNWSHPVMLVNSALAVAWMGAVATHRGGWNV